MKKLLFAGLLSLCLSAPAFAEMQISRTQGWQGTDDGIDATWNNDGTYMELLTSTTVFRIALSGGGLILGSTAAINAQADVECGGEGKFFLPNRMSEARRDSLTMASGDKGAVIFNTTTNKLNVYNGTAWEAVTSS